MIKDKLFISYIVMIIVCLVILFYSSKSLMSKIENKNSKDYINQVQTEKRINNLEFKIDSLILESEKTKVIIDSLYQEVYYYEHW